MDLYRDHILDHYKHPRNKGALHGADVVGEAANPVCGDRLSFGYKVRNGRIGEVRFTGEGCAISQAGASLLTELVVGKTVAEAARLPDEALLKAIGVPLSPARLPCGLLALVALRDAARSSQRKRNPV